MVVLKCASVLQMRLFHFSAMATLTPKKKKKKESFTLKRWVPSIKSTLAVSEVLYSYSFLHSARFFPRRRRRRLLDQSHTNTRAHTLGGRRWTRASADFWWFLLSLKFLEPNCSTDHKCHITPPLLLLRISPPPSLFAFVLWLTMCVYVWMCSHSKYLPSCLSFVVFFLDTWSNFPTFHLCFPPLQRPQWEPDSGGSQESFQRNHQRQEPVSTILSHPSCCLASLSRLN